jgi:hypothetical protein
MSCRAVFVVLLDQCKGWGSLLSSVVRDLAQYNVMELPQDAEEPPSEPCLRRAVGRKGEESSVEVNELSVAGVPPRCA